MALTDAALRRMLKGHDEKKPIKMADGKGLTALCRPSGSVMFIYRYETKIDGKFKERVVTLGEYTGKPGGLTLAQARERAGECKGWRRDGFDPAIKMRSWREANTNQITVRGMLEFWLEDYAKNNRANHEKHRQQLSKWIYPAIGDLPLMDCKREHWLTVFAEYKRSAPVACGGCLQMCKQAVRHYRIMKNIQYHELDDLTASVVGEKQQARKRVLCREELADVYRWSGLESTNDYYANLVSLLLMFPARTQEVRKSHVSEWNLSQRIWKVPPGHSKNGNEIERAIPEYAVPFVERLINSAKGNGSDYLLGELKRPEAVSQYGRGICDRLGHTEKWTIHDLRRSIATTMTRLGVQPHIIEILLGHALDDTRKAYIHDPRLKEQEEALNLWWGALDKTA